MHLADIDFETYSEAGFHFDPAANRWRGKGIKDVGAGVYAEHPSTEILLLAYDLKDGEGPQQWMPGMAPPTTLFDYIERPGLIRAWYSLFEFYIWHYVCHLRMGWPQIHLAQLRDPMARARAHSIPGGMEIAGTILDAPVQKQKDGARLIKKFSCPRAPTVDNPNKRLYMQNDPSDLWGYWSADTLKYCGYNLGDIKAQDTIVGMLPELSLGEQNLWLLDQRINVKGVYIDKKGLDDCISIVNQATEKYTAELVRITGEGAQITGEAIKTSGELQKMGAWLELNGLPIDNMKAGTIDDVLKKQDLPYNCRRVLEIRQILGSASVKKLFSIERHLSSDGRLRNLFNFCGALRTGRWTGSDTQPQNLRSSGPKAVPADQWGPEAMDKVFEVIGSRNLLKVEQYYKDPIDAVAGCLRGLFSAPPGYDLICSDFSAIEAVCLAELAGERWRQEVFQSHGKIYETSASKITGIPLEEFFEHKKRTGSHHPMRSKIGKVAELASGYQGWIGAWKNFGADKHFDNDYAIKKAILRWREESPAIVEFWGGQWRKDPHAWVFTPELYGLEGAAVSAVLNPGHAYRYRMIAYGVQGDVLYCLLPSGRKLTYHSPRLTFGQDNYSKQIIYKLSYMGWNTDRAKGPYGWTRLGTYGGKLAENVTQAVARDILAYAMLAIDYADYPIVLHVHDEAVTEKPQGEGSVEEVEWIMGNMPAWCRGWPVRASGGWRGRRYRKD